MIGIRRSGQMTTSSQLAAVVMEKMIHKRKMFVTGLLTFQFATLGY